MIEFLNKIRVPDNSGKMVNKIINTILIFIFGIMLGIFSKWLDNMSINDEVWYERIIGILDLRNIFSSFGIWFLIALIISVYSKTSFRSSLNVFVFFVGMTVSYHLYTIFFSGFNPLSYMMIWYILTLVSPILAFICWYAKSKSRISIFICALILCVMVLSSFNIGMWYFDLKSIIDLIIFISSVIVLYERPKNSIFSLIIAFILAFIFRIIV